MKLIANFAALIIAVYLAIVFLSGCEAETIQEPRPLQGTSQSIVGDCLVQPHGTSETAHLYRCDGGHPFGSDNQGIAWNDGQICYNGHPLANTPPPGTPCTVFVVQMVEEGVSE